MTPLEILEAHQIGGFKSDGHNRVVICSGCQKRLTGQGRSLDDIIRAHVAQVLDEAMREAKAEAWEVGYTQGRRDQTERRYSAAQPTNNPYRKTLGNLAD